MERFEALIEKIDKTKEDADKFYTDDNLQAGKRLFAALMDISRSCKDAREELSERRKIIRNERGIKY